MKHDATSMTSSEKMHSCKTMLKEMCSGLGTPVNEAIDQLLISSTFSSGLQCLSLTNTEQVDTQCLISEHVRCTSTQSFLRTCDPPSFLYVITVCHTNIIMRALRRLVCEDHTHEARLHGAGRGGKELGMWFHGRVLAEMGL